MFDGEILERENCKVKTRVAITLNSSLRGWARRRMPTAMEGDGVVDGVFAGLVMNLQPDGEKIQTLDRIKTMLH